MCLIIFFASSFLASGSYMSWAGDRFCIPAPTVSLIIRQVCEAIWEEYNAEMFPPWTEERVLTIMDRFWKLWNFPNCFGALDGRHCVCQVRKE